MMLCSLLMYNKVNQLHIYTGCMCSVTQEYSTLCNPTDCSPTGSSVHGIFQARIPEGVAIFSSRGYSRPRDRIHTYCIADRFFTAEPLGKTHINIYPLFFRLFSHLGHYRVLSTVPCAIQ